MKTKLITLFTTLFSVFMLTVHAQDNPSLRYNMLKTDYKTKNYDSAIKHLDWCLDNAPKLTANIYKYGGSLLKAKFKKATPEEKPQLVAVGKKLFEARFVNFPNLDPAKGHSDYGDFLTSAGASKDEVFSHYDQAYKLEPTKLGPKSIINYFTQVIERNEETTPQVIFDTYDVTMEAIDKKVEGYLSFIQQMQEKEDAGETILSKEKRKLHSYTINSKALGQIGTILDQKIEALSTCERLIPLYTGQFEEFKTDGLWLKRAINRMFAKECTSDALYAKMVQQYQEVSPSPQASVFYAGILLEKGETNKALEYFNKAVTQEEDKAKKAKYLFKIATIMQKKGRSAKAVSYAKKALAQKPNLGRAYTMIATLYAKSSNSCGTDEFKKRMVYVAAENYARKAARVDPSISSYALKLAKSYEATKPSKKLVFNNDLGLKSGDSYKIGCWIGETVRVP
ncbi:hypothetical protein N9901_00110 [Flavobacteriaceae bacterium]|nr:hypothetical protein [Flavobacteriaceae bacterium]